jgi:hypothetical protein
MKGKFIWILLFISLQLCACGGGETSHSESVESLPYAYYVSPQGNDEWSGTLAEPNSEGMDGPFRTIVKARNVIKLRNQSFPQTEDIKVLIRDGIYGPLDFNPSDSGQNGFRIIYKNYRDEKPIISGGIELTGWELYDENIYTTRVDGDFSVQYENDQTSVLARHPNRDPEAISPGKHAYLKIARAYPDHEHEGFYFDPEIFPVLEDWSRLQMVTWNGGEHGEFHWRTYPGVITELSYENQTIMANLMGISQRWVDMLGPGTEYFIQNSLDLLDAPGEFFLDGNRLYYWPLSLPIEDQTVIVPRMRVLINLIGSESDPVENLTFQGLDFRYTDSRDLTVEDETASAIYLENARGITFNGNRFQQVGGAGIYAKGGGVQGITIKNNLFQYIGGSAVQIEGDWGANQESNNHLILNNHIHHTGIIVPSARGIVISIGSHNRVAHNLLHDIPKGAIGIGGTGNLDTATGSDNVVEFNEIHHVLQDSQDMGPIYFGGAGPDNQIHNNYVHDVFGLFSIQGGIYMDQFSKGFSITHNLVEKFGQEGGGFTNGVIDAADIETTIQNNILAFNDVELTSVIFPREYSLTIAGETNTAADTPPNDIDVLSNIFYNNEGPIYKFRFGHEGSTLRQSDHNLFYNKQDLYLVTGIPGVTTLQDWQALEDRIDPNSVFGDPLFIDPENRDYRLRFDSPAYALGFEDLNFVDMGLTADFPFASPDSTLSRMYIISDLGGHSANLTLSTGESAQLKITARTASGYVADPNTYQQSCTSEDPSIAGVNDTGEVTGEGAGFTTITCSVEVDGAQLSLPVFVLVDIQPAEAALLVPIKESGPEITPFLGTLLGLDFETELGVFKHWPSHNSWELVEEDGRTLYCGFAEEAGTQSEFGSKLWGDYQVDARMRIVGGEGAGLRLRVFEVFSQHDIDIGSEKTQVTQIFCGLEECTNWQGVWVDFEEGEWVQFRAEVEGYTIQTYLNGRLMLTQTLEHSELGNVGIRSRAGTTLCLDDIYVRSLDRSPEAIALAPTGVAVLSTQIQLFPGEDQPVIGSLGVNQTVYLLAWSEDVSWVKIRQEPGNVQGWVLAKNLQITETE